MLLQDLLHLPSSVFPFVNSQHFRPTHYHSAKVNGSLVLGYYKEKNHYVAEFGKDETTEVILLKDFSRPYVYFIPLSFKAIFTPLERVV